MVIQCLSSTMFHHGKMLKTSASAWEAVQSNQSQPLINMSIDFLLTLPMLEAPKYSRYVYLQVWGKHPAAYISVIAYICIVLFTRRCWRHTSLHILMNGISEQSHWGEFSAIFPWCSWLAWSTISSISSLINENDTESATFGICNWSNSALHYACWCAYTIAHFFFFISYVVPS